METVRLNCKYCMTVFDNYIIEVEQKFRKNKDYIPRRITERIGENIKKMKEFSKYTKLYFDALEIIRNGPVDNFYTSELYDQISQRDLGIRVTDSKICWLRDKIRKHNELLFNCYDYVKNAVDKVVKEN